MAYEQKDGEISLFKNKKKEGKQPDMRGSLKINGQTYWVAMWVREKEGEKYLTGKVEEPRDDFSTKANKPSDLPF